ncbi:MAG TPA: CopG family antitoxin [Candidatus Saccharimonadales bacterium]|nr:CopG family antitoxin [Candidatus Saccharimonadales bacterium]
MEKTPEKKKPIPDFKNRQEMAEWFDTHDMTEYAFKPVKALVLRDQPKDKTLVVRMQEPLRKKLDQIATSKGLNASSLARMWLIEKLQQTGH